MNVIKALKIKAENDKIFVGGCGAFGNKREKVLPSFERAINKYTDGNAEIIFAIP